MSRRVYMDEYGYLIYAVPRHDALDARLARYNDCILRGNSGILEHDTFGRIINDAAFHLPALK